MSAIHPSKDNEQLSLIQAGSARPAFTAIAGSAAVLQGILAFAGILFNITLFKSFLPGFVQMNSITAVNFILIGIYLIFLAGKEKIKIGYGLNLITAVIVLLSLLSFFSQVFPVNINADLLLPELLRSQSSMSIYTALIFIFLSLSLYFYSLNRHLLNVISQYIVLFCGFFAMLVVLGYIYNITSFYYSGTSHPMALNTGALFILSALGILFKYNNEGPVSLLKGSTPGTILTRRLIPVIIILPVILGWLRLFGENAELYNFSTGVAIFVIVIIVMLFFFILYNAAKLRKAEIEKEAFENEILSNEMKFRAIIDNSPSAIYLKDLERRFILVNKTTQKNHGLTEPEFIGKTLTDLFPFDPGAVKVYEDHDWEVLTYGEVKEFEEQAMLADGMHTYISHKFPLRDSGGNIYAMCGISTDITDRKNESDRTFAILNSAPDAIVIVDGKGIIKIINMQAEKLFGYNREELLGKRVEVLIPEELRKRHEGHRESFSQQHSVREMGSGLELYAVRKDGTQFPVEISLSPLDTNEGILVSAAIRDITDRKKKDEKLKQLNNRLTESNHELESFSYSVSHDLRAPLRHVIGFGEKLKRVSANSLSEEESRLLNKITSSADKMGRLIDDLLMFSRVGRTGLSIAETDMKKLVAECINEAEQHLQGNKINWILKDIPPVMADQFQLKLVMGNLIGNAVKYTSKASERFIEIGSFEGKEEIIYYIKDSGCGFDMEYKDKLFGVFQRLHRDNEYEGTGIGLATVRRIITRHNGRVWAESETGKGAVFYFSLPKK